MTLPRPHMGLKVKLAAALHALGLDPDDVEFDHDPALVHRKRNPDGTYQPGANDFRFIVPRSKAAHKRKTFGNGAATRGSDIGEAAHVRRVGKKEQEFRDRLNVKAPGKPRERKSRIRSRNNLRKENRRWSPHSG